MTTDDIIVRPACVRDLEEIFIIQKRCIKLEQFNRRQLRYLLTKAKAINFVAINRGTLCGYYIGLIRGETLLRSYMTAVDPDHRQKGVFLRLIQHAEMFAKILDITRVISEVRIDNHLVQRIKTKRGYTIFGRYSNYYSDGCDAYRMMKEL